MCYWKLAISIIVLMMHSSAFTAEQAKDIYQVDILIFAQTNPQPPQEMRSIPMQNAHMLEKGEGFYHLLPASVSQLNNEYYALRKKSQYQILAHYSWLQPLKGKRKLLLKPESKNGWQLHGTLDIEKHQHYQLNAKLAISTEDNTHYYLLNKMERLKANQLYYLDHPGVGIFIRIHHPTSHS